MRLSESESWRLASFRRAARQVRDASIIARGQKIEIHAAPGDPGYVDIFVKLLSDEPFRSLALAIRLVYQQSEPAHFLSICNLVSKHWPQQRDRVVDLRTQYLATLRDDARRISVNDGREPRFYTAQQVFENWLHGIAFHQDAERQNAVEHLESEGARFLWSVQAISLQLAGRVLDLDDVIADATGDERLPRI